MKKIHTPPEVKSVNGLRVRKKRETRNRIADHSLKLFIEKGYEETTLEEIAAASDISRRTFFSYFRSKEDVLLAKYDGLLEALRVEMLGQSTKQPPFDAVCKCLLNMASRYVTKETVILDRLMRSTETLRNRKEVFYLEMENVLTETLGEMWPAKSAQPSLSLVAMILTGTLRISQNNWRHDEGKHSLTHYLDRNFALLKEHSLNRLQEISN